jgi:hypothetical protein
MHLCDLVSSYAKTIYPDFPPELTSYQTRRGNDPRMKSASQTMLLFKIRVPNADFRDGWYEGEVVATSVSTDQKDQPQLLLE